MMDIQQLMKVLGPQMKSPVTQAGLGDEQQMQAGLMESMPNFGILQLLGDDIGKAGILGQLLK